MTFIDAGAGTGKTTRLVRRVVRLVLDGTCPIERIAAITFTEKAAAELRDRVRVALLRASRGEPIDDVNDDPAGAMPTGAATVAAATDALTRFHEAPISTLHAFALRLLQANADVVGLPGVDIIDDLAQAERFERRWQATIQHLLTDDILLAALDRSVALGVDLPRWRTIANELDGQWDRCQRWTAHVTAPNGLRPIPLSDVIDALTRVLALARAATAGGCEDKLADLICAQVPARLDHLRAVDPTDSFAACHALIGAVVKAGNIGSAKKWAGVAEAKRLVRSAADVLGEVANDTFTPILAFLAGEAVTSANNRRASGLITYHDVLVLARELVCEHPASRVRCRQQYAYLLIDEFQDTDPLQAELALALSFAGDVGVDDPADAGVLPRGEFDLEAGRLAFVGDPKQSIYRFRRADVGVYEQMKHRFDGHVEVLDANYRSRPPIVDWVNTVFAALMAGPGKQRQVPFQKLTAARPEPAPTPGGPATFAFGGPFADYAHAGGDDPKTIEATAVASVVHQALSGWEIIDNDTKQRRIARPSDVAVLLRTRTLLPELSRILTSIGVPFRFEGKGLAWESQEIADVLTLLAAVDDPADPAKVVAALRCRAIGASDDELLAWKHTGERFTIRDHAPLEGAVPEGLTWLHSLRQRRFRVTVPDLVRAVIRERALDVVALAQIRPRDAWGRLQLLVDTADQFVASSTTATLREFLARCAWAAEQGATSSDRIVTEPDDEAVRILTIHGAKGLEFPVAIVAGLGQATRHGGLAVHWDRIDGRTDPEPVMKVEVRVGDDFTDVDVRGRTFRDVAGEESDADALETERLAYVACTRARDHLAVSLFHKPVNNTTDGKARIGADLHATVLHTVFPIGLLLELPADHSATDGFAGAEGSWGSTVHTTVSRFPDGWAAERRALLDTPPSTPELRTGRPSGHDNTTPAHPVDETATDGRVDATAGPPHAEMLPPIRVRSDFTPVDTTAARRFGSAVHYVAERMAPGDTADQLAAYSAEAAAMFAVTDVDRVRSSVDALRSSSAWQRASTAPRSWRELPLDGTVNGREGI